MAADRTRLSITSKTSRNRKGSLERNYQIKIRYTGQVNARKAA